MDRFDHSSEVVLGTLHLLGGWFSSTQATTEHLDPATQGTTWSQGFELKSGFYQGCLAKISTHEIVVLSSAPHAMEFHKYNVTSGFSTKFSSLPANQVMMGFCHQNIHRQALKNAPKTYPKSDFSTKSI